MSDTPTPRTDAEQFTIWEGPAFGGKQHEVVPLTFARELERENAALHEDKANMDWLAKHSAIVAHPINYDSVWDGDFRKRINAYRRIIGNRRIDQRDEPQTP